MAHRALTLKYRPQVFADMIGQEHVSAVLSRALESGRIAHAYLFTGPRGVGKTTAARIVAKSLNCIRRASGELKGADPCNTCPSCQEITAGVSLDVIEIDGASNRGIADVQALREKVRFAPTGGHYRVVIIDEVHQLSNDAFAALLKTLEEPPPHLVFVFATTDPQKLPDTIRSRTQRFDFARVPLRKVADRLIEIARREQADPEGVKFTLQEGAALLLAHKSEGSMRDAVGALDQVISSGEREITEELVRRVLGLADREVFFALGQAIVDRDPKAALHALHEGFDKGMDARDLADGLSEHVRHILLLKVDPEGGADLVAAGAEDLARLKSQGSGWSQDDLLRLLRLASEITVPMKESPQPLIHLEAAVVQMATMEAGETLGEILRRLEVLEQRLHGAGPGDGGARRMAPGAPAAAPPTVRERAPDVPQPSRTAPRGPGGGAPRGYAAPMASPFTAAPAAAPVRATAPAPAATVTATAEPASEALERDEVAETCWRAVIEGINARKRMLGAFLEEIRFLGLGGAAVVVAMDDLHRNVIEEKDNRTLVMEEVARAFGRPLALRCAPASAAAGLAPAPAAPAAKDVTPLIDQAIAWFQGDVIERRSERTT